MTTLLHPRLTRIALASLSLCLAASTWAQLRTDDPNTDPDTLACAAGLRCSQHFKNNELAPNDVRIILGLNDAEHARQRLDQVSKQWPDEVWSCAGTGKGCPKGMSQQDALDQIPMDPASIVEVDKRKRGDPTIELEKPSPTQAVEHADGISVEVSKPEPGRKGKGRKPGIEVEQPGPTRSVENPAGISVEVNEPGPSEITLQPPTQEIQPLDGTWSLVHGATAKQGNCPAMLMNAVGNVGADANDTRALRFSKPFHPNSISGPEGNWQRVAPDHWRSATTAEGGAAKLTTDLYVMSPSLMQGQIVIEFNIPGQCRHVLTTPYSHKRQG